MSVVPVLLKYSIIIKNRNVHLTTVIRSVRIISFRNATLKILSIFNGIVPHLPPTKLLKVSTQLSCLFQGAKKELQNLHILCSLWLINPCLEYSPFYTSSFLLFVLQISLLKKMVKISAHTDGVPRSPSAHHWPFARPLISMSGNFPAHMSAESPSNISPNPSEVISEVSEP